MVEKITRVGCCAAIATGALLLLHGGGPLRAQVLEQGVISEQGTQFVTEPQPPSPPPPPPAEPPARPAPPRQAPAVKEPPATSSPPPSPPRYPAVVFLLDTSDSMLNRVSGRRTTLLDEAKAAMRRVIDGMSEQTRAQVWVFNTWMRKLKMPRETSSGFVRVGPPGSRTRDLLTRAVDGVKTAGGTNLYQAIVKTLEIFADPRDQPAYRSGERFPVLVVISDGEDWGKSRHTLDSVIAAKKRFPLVTINAIGFNASENDKWFADLCRIATRPEGCATANDRAQLQAILDSFYRYRPPTS